MPSIAGCCDSRPTGALAAKLTYDVRRELAIVDGKTARLDLELAVVLRARPVPNAKPKGLTYWLFFGSAPRDGADARARSMRETSPSLTVDAGAALAPVELANPRERDRPRS